MDDNAGGTLADVTGTAASAGGTSMENNDYDGHFGEEDPEDEWLDTRHEEEDYLSGEESEDDSDASSEGVGLGTYGMGEY